MPSVNQYTLLIERLAKLEKHILDIRTELKAYKKTATKKKDDQEIKKIKGKISQL